MQIAMQYWCVTEITSLNIAENSGQNLDTIILVTILTFAITQYYFRRQKILKNREANQRRPNTEGQSVTNLETMFCLTNEPCYFKAHTC